MATNQVTTFATGLTAFTVDLKVGPDGALYSLSRDGGVVNRIQFTNSQAPSIGQHPADVTIGDGQSATLAVIASGAAPLSYQWQRDGADIAGATQASYTIDAATPADSGARFRAVVTNAFGSATSNEAALTVLADRAPTAAITAPAVGSLYQGGQTILYAGAGTDTEDGTLPPSAFTWRVDFHHADHTHPFLPDAHGAASGQFTIPTVGETATDVFYRVHLTVRDSAGLSDSTFVDVQPTLATIRLLTKPNGLTIRLDGQPFASPMSVLGVVGMRRTIEAIDRQVGVDGWTYAFGKWSDRGAREHTITFPATNTA